MTTICVKDGIIAADTKITGSSYAQHDFNKVFKVGKEWIGLAGHCSKFKEYVSWYKSDRDDEPPDDVQCIVLHTDGTVSIFEDGESDSYTRTKYGAIGTGAGNAMGSMWNGATAIEGVQCAIDLDPTGCTGGDIVYDGYKKNINKVTIPENAIWMRDYGKK